MIKHGYILLLDNKFPPRKLQPLQGERSCPWGRQTSWQVTAGGLALPAAVTSSRKPDLHDEGAGASAASDPIVAFCDSSPIVAHGVFCSKCQGGSCQKHWIRDKLPHYLLAGKTTEMPPPHHSGYGLDCHPTAWTCAWGPSKAVGAKPGRPTCSRGLNHMRILLNSLNSSSSSP